MDWLTKDVCTVDCSEAEDKLIQEFKFSYEYSLNVDKVYSRDKMKKYFLGRVSRETMAGVMLTLQQSNL